MAEMDNVFSGDPEQQKEVSKYMFDAVHNAQENLRLHLDELSESNRVIQDAKERELFMSELCYSLLGLGTQHIIRFDISEYKDILKECNPDRSFFAGVYIRAHVEKVSRWLAYQKDNMVSVPMSFGSKLSSEKIFVPIGLLWSCLRDGLFSVFPLALSRSCGMDKLREERGSSEEFDFNE